MARTSALALITLISWSPARQQEKLLARIPEGLEIGSDLVRLNNRSAFQRRPSLAWSPDGRRVAYAAVRDQQDYVPVIGNEVGEPFPFVGLPRLAGEHAVFHVGVSRGKGEETHWLWIDGKKLGPEDWIDEPEMRADGKQIAYWSAPGAKVGNADSSGKARSILVVATDSGSQWSRTRGGKWLDCGAIAFSGDGNRIFAAALDRKGWTIVQAGKRETALFEPVPSIESFSVSADGSALAWVRANAPSDASSAFLRPADQSQLLFLEKRVGRTHEVVSTATVDPRGRHVAYVVTRGAQRAVVIDEEPKPARWTDFALELRFDPNGERLAFVSIAGGAEDPELPGRIVGGAWTVVVRALDAATEPIEQGPFLEVRDLVWDAQGERLAFAARDETGWRVHCGEKHGEAHAEVGTPVFAPDALALGFGSRDANELWWRLLDLSGR